MQVTLVRHTRVDVPRGVCYGWSDVPCAPTFEEEATLTRSRLEGIAFDKVYTSPLSRARRLAAFCGWPDAEADDRLKEMYMGEWEMKRYDEIDDPELQEWYADYMNKPTKGGESLPMLYARVADFLDELCRQPYERVCIFAHAGVLVCAGIYGGLFARDDAFAHQVDYGGIEEIDL